jgi:ubiquinone/menaquinone biosynthesis C-methylase UbiE
MKSTVNLLPKSALIKTGEVDHADWNYRPLLGTISSARFRLVNKLLNGKQEGSLLEIGYGSGVFMPQLSHYAKKLYGIDIHDRNQEISRKLSDLNIHADLVSGRAENMPYADDSFDIVVAVSTLEFVDNLNQVCQEVKRILKPNGNFVVVTPGKSALIDFGLKVMTGVSAQEDFGNSRNLIIPTLRRSFNIKKELKFPKKASSIVKLYTALELTC